MTDQDRKGDQRHGRDEPGRVSNPAPGLGGEPEPPSFESEPLAGEGVDEEEATITRGPGVGGTSGVASEGTAEDATR